ncbi:MAG: hypothetical protein ACRDRS_06430 [Pseudonocardiaceae bacterium]
MKFSISVPDELWESARAVITADSPSAVVQEALRRLSSEDVGSPSYAQPPVMEDELAAALAATRERLLEEARSLYQDGYRRGVTLAGELDWWQLSKIVAAGVVAVAKSIAQQGFDVLTGRIPPEASPWIEAKLLAKYVGNHADYTGSVPWTPSPVTVEGMDRALRDVWELVRTPDGASAICPPKPRAEQ